MIYNGKLIKMTEYIRNTLVFLLKKKPTYPTKKIAMSLEKNILSGYFLPKCEKHELL